MPVAKIARRKFVEQFFVGSAIGAAIALALTKFGWHPPALFSRNVNHFDFDVEWNRVSPALVLWFLFFLYWSVAARNSASTQRSESHPHILSPNRSQYSARTSVLARSRPHRLVSAPEGSFSRRHRPRHPGRLCSARNLGAPPSRPQLECRGPYRRRARTCSFRALPFFAPPHLHGHDRHVPGDRRCIKPVSCAGWTRHSNLRVLTKDALGRADSTQRLWHGVRRVPRGHLGTRSPAVLRLPTESGSCWPSMRSSLIVSTCIRLPR